MALRLYDSEPDSIFGLLGDNENSATIAIGWALERCAVFRKLILESLIGHSARRAADVVVELQHHDDQKGGYTDIELIAPGTCHIIIEAKRGWTIPGRKQLATYAKRLSKHSKDNRQIVSLSAADRRYALRRLPSKISGVPLTHRSWGNIQKLAESARRQCRKLTERLWLSELVQHLEGYVSMQSLRDNQVYVLSLSRLETRKGNGYTWTDIVEKNRQYFHPVGGNGWPTVPPNYIGFRYHGLLQSVHHIESYRVVTNLASINRKWPRTDGDHFVYELGPAMKPVKSVRTGNLFKAQRVWCAIDLLLSGACETISQARDETKIRLKNAGVEDVIAPMRPRRGSGKRAKRAKHAERA